MPRMIKDALTIRRLDTLKACAAIQYVADGGGLYFVVEPTGAKRWAQRIVTASGRTWRGLGAYPVVGLADARDASYAIRRELKHGAPFVPVAAYDTRPRVNLPALPSPAPRKVPTFRAAARLACRAQKANWKNPKSAAQFMARLKAHAFPTIGRTRINAVTPADLNGVLAPLWTTKAATADKVRQALSTVMDWALGNGHHESERVMTLAAKGLPRRGKGTTKNHAAMAAADVGGFLVDVWGSDNALSVRAAMLFTVLTAKRSGEVRFARWPEFDLDAALWTIPADRTKSGREHIEPLSAQAVAVLRAMEAIRRPDGFVFPSAREGSPLSDMTLSQLMKRGGYVGVVHGFRSTFMDWACDNTDYPEEVREACLGHAVNDKTVAAYKRTTFIDKRRALMAEWAAFATTSTASASLPLMLAAA